MNFLEIIPFLEEGRKIGMDGVDAYVYFYQPDKIFLTEGFTDWNDPMNYAPNEKCLIYHNHQTSFAHTHWRPSIDDLKNNNWVVL